MFYSYLSTNEKQALYIWQWLDLSMCLCACIACLAWKLLEKKHELDVIVTLLVDTHTEREKLPKPLLLTLRSVYHEGQVTAAVRELEVGCIHSSQQHNKKVHFILYLPEDTHISQAVEINYVGNLNTCNNKLLSLLLSFLPPFLLFSLLFSALFVSSLLISVCLTTCRMESFYGRM